MTPNWHRHPPIAIPSPILSVLPGPNGVIAGGLGGVARYDERGWHPLLPGLPLTSVTALALAGETLLAGGTGGIALSPAFAEDGTALAATLDNGVLRSAAAATQQRLLAAIEAAGCNYEFDEWGGRFAWMKTYRPDAASGF
jgi:hypothetical protein